MDEMKEKFHAETLERMKKGKQITIQRLKPQMKRKFTKFAEENFNGDWAATFTYLINHVEEAHVLLNVINNQQMMRTQVAQLQILFNESVKQAQQIRKQPKRQTIKLRNGVEIPK